VKRPETPIIIGQSYTEAFPDNAWLLVNGIVPQTTKGTPTTNDVLITETRVSTCIHDHPTKTPSERESAQRECYRSLDLENASVYIGTNEFWTLQLREGLLYLVSGLILIGGTGLLSGESSPKATVSLFFSLVTSYRGFILRHAIEGGTNSNEMYRKLP
jgi:hypothetical protein